MGDSNNTTDCTFDGSKPSEVKRRTRTSTRTRTPVPRSVRDTGHVWSVLYYCRVLQLIMEPFTVTTL